MAGGVDLLVVRAEDRDRDTQRCRLGPALMRRLGLRLGSPLRLRLRDASCLCSAWPRPDLAEGFLQVRPLCASPELDGQELVGLRLQEEHVQPISCPRLSAVTVRAFVRGGADRPLSEAMLRPLLEGVYVQQGHVVRLPGSEVECVLVEKLSGGRSTGVVTGVTRVEVSGVGRVRRAPGRVAPPLAGLEDVYASLTEMLRLPLRYPGTLRLLALPCPRGLLLMGPPGVGKSALVRRVAGDLGATLLTLGGAEVTGARPGESEENLRRVFAEARAAAAGAGPCLLLMDEVESLCPRRSGAPEARLVAQLLTLMDGLGGAEGLVIVGTTNRPHALDPALRRPGRFDREVVIGAPSLRQRLRILQSLCRDVPLDADVDLSAVAQMSGGYVAADLSALCRDATLRAMRSSQAVQMQHFSAALHQVCASCVRSSEGACAVGAVRWDQVGGLQEVKLKLQQCVEWPLRFPQAFARLGVSRPRGVLLHGPPGCAKTTLVRAAATASRCSFFSLTAAQLFSPHVGDSEKTLAQLFAQARACSPSIVFLDEIDSMVGERSAGVQSQVLAVLLTELDGVGLRAVERRREDGKRLELEGGEDESQSRLRQLESCHTGVLIVAATNRPDAVDAALLRPGRLDRIIHVPPPDRQGRVEVLRVCTAATPLHQDVCLERLAEEAELFTGADVEHLCREACLEAVRAEGFSVACVKQQHFLKVLQSFRPSLSLQHDGQDRIITM